MFLKLIDKDDYKFLYDLLSERSPEVNISHRTMPTYEQHVDFCRSYPYLFWFVIVDYNSKRMGSIYKTPLGEIGIFIKKEFQGKGIAKEIIPMIYNIGVKRNLANIAPGNERSKKLFEGLGFKKIQETYELFSN